MTRPRKLVTLAAIGGAALVALTGVAIVIFDYVSTRSASSLLLDLNQLPPGTPFEEFERRFGTPLHHLTHPTQVREWGPLSDPELISNSDLYLFVHPSSPPHRYICVYRHKTTGQVTKLPRSKEGRVVLPAQPPMTVPDALPPYGTRRSPPHRVNQPHQTTTSSNPEGSP